MGNWLGMIRTTLHPLDHEGNESKNRLIRQSRGATRIKVRMTASRLKELMAQAASSKGSQEQLGRMILQEGLEGKFGARVVSTHDEASAYAGTLSSIKEE